MSTLLQKQIRHLRPTRLTLWVRQELEQHCRERLVPKMGVPTQVNVPLDDEPALLVSGRTVHMGRFECPQDDAVMVDEGSVIRIARVRSPGLGPADVWQRSDRWLKLLDLPRTRLQSRMVESLWDLIHWNEESLIEDFAHLGAPPRQPPPGPYHLVNEAEVWLADNVSLGPGCVLDATKGPVTIGEHAVIGANAVVQGPCAIGPYATVTPLAMIRPGCSIGIMCKVGGEISQSIVLGYSNKAHEGFLGHSYMGKWVNLGAGTTTSNLKNTYGEVTMQMGTQEIPTGRVFLGSVIGDHTKTAILTRLMTGSYVGFCTQISGSGPPPRFIPSFTFWGDRGAERYRMDKAIEVVQRAFGRRDRAWTASDERMMKYVAATAPAVETRDKW